jgi:hypothetical protein
MLPLGLYVVRLSDQADPCELGSTKESVMKRWLGLGYVVALVFTAACARTDTGITTAVKTKLAADETVKAYQVNVDTHDHIVTLSGVVDSAVAKNRAVVLAREADGVRDVIDNIRLNDAVATTGRDVINDGADATADGVRRAGDATANGVRRGADAVAGSAEKTGHAVNREAHDADIDHKAKEGSDVVVDSAKKVGHATKKGAEAVADGAKKVGSEIKHSVTDNDHDSDKDGK